MKARLLGRQRALGSVNPRPPQTTSRAGGGAAAAETGRGWEVRAREPACPRCRLATMLVPRLVSPKLSGPQGV